MIWSLRHSLESRELSLELYTCQMVTYHTPSRLNYWLTNKKLGSSNTRKNTAHDLILIKSRMSQHLASSAPGHCQRISCSQWEAHFFFPVRQLGWPNNVLCPWGTHTHAHGHTHARTYTHRKTDRQTDKHTETHTHTHSLSLSLSVLALGHTVILAGNLLLSRSWSRNRKTACNMCRFSKLLPFFLL